MTPVFVDTNVLVYARDTRDPLKQARAAEWLDRLWQQRTGRTSMQVLCEFYAVATRRLSPRHGREVVWEEVQRYLAWSPIAIDGTLIRRAHDVERRYGISWWDSMIVAAAQSLDCALLLTEDLQEGMAFGTLAVRSPFSSVLEEPGAHYHVPRPAPLHRPRGRPKRAALAV